MTTGRRGRVRSEEARRAILEATATLLAASGYEQLSVDRIATTAGVGKQTVYRWWSSKSAVIAECLLDGYVLSDLIVPAKTGDARSDVGNWLRALVDFLDDPKNAALFRALAAAASENREVSDRLYERFSGPLHTALVECLRAGIRAGQVRDDAPVPAVADILIGAVLHRALAHIAIPLGTVDGVVDALFSGVAAAARED
ncbi:TetR/AcrR family transcriptional regulator [Planotetraspora phitsanulokensis]|uniref:TetR family transcriptional regulator n=1 Tax=Planotetraspora phitsanulokensis TaxID=575192 RepID=A0A8J3U3W4_9ACTN|nr:TetR/AcrR family transcriptional regulator [Planotetraspora phitsanulokensis]GII37944.1 TetR family transcriptional regulator [Planotetraspora phitsanulokensis]